MTRNTRWCAVASLLAGLLAAANVYGQAAEPLPTEVTPQVLPERDDVLQRAFTAHPGGLTADQVAARAVPHSTALRASRAEIEAAAAQVDAAMIRFLPRVTLAATYTRLSPTDNSLTGGGALVGAANPGMLSVGPCPMGAGDCVLDSAGRPVGAAAFELETALDNYSLRASLSVPISDYVLKMSSSITGARENQDAAERSQRARRAEVEANGRVAFYNWARGLGQLAVAEDSLVRTRARLSEAQATFRLGAATQADVLRLEAMVASTEAAIERARAFSDVAAEQLRVITGGSADPIALGEDILGRQPPALRDGVTLASLVQRATTQRLELRALSATQRSLEHATKVVERGALPRLDAFADYTYANPNQRSFPQTGGWSGSWQAGATLSWTYNEAFAAGATSRELSANTQRVAAQAQALRDGVRLEVTQAYFDLRRARAAAVAAQRAHEASAAAYKVASSLYRYGRATTTDLIEAEGELVSAQLQRINAQIDLLVADVRLRHATGAGVGH